MCRFEGAVLWITLRDCETLEEALRPFERAMKNPAYFDWKICKEHMIGLSMST
jgi:hypothetical protein